MKSAKELVALWKLSKEELNKELTSTKEALFKMRFQKQVEEMVDRSVIRKSRKKIAQINTILRERELGIVQKKEKENSKSS